MFVPKASVWSWSLNEDLTKWKHWLNHKLLSMGWVPGVSICPSPAVCTAQGRSGEVSGAAELVSSNFQMWFPDVLRVYFPANPGFAALLCQQHPMHWWHILSYTTTCLWCTQQSTENRGIGWSIENPAGEHGGGCGVFECFADSGLARGSLHASALLGFINETITCIWRQDHTVRKLLCFHFYWFSHCKNIPKPNQILVLVW